MKSKLEKPKITDWIQAIGAVIAAVGLVLNLSLQLTYTKSQLQINNRDYTRYIKEQLPVLNFKFIYRLPRIGSISYEVINNPAYKLRVLNISHRCYTFNGAVNTTLDLNIETPQIINYKVDETKLRQDTMKNTQIAFDVFFEDNVGNQYRQDVYTFIGYDGFLQSVPVLVRRSIKSDTSVKLF